LERLQEAVQIIKLKWSKSPATFEGKYYSRISAITALFMLFRAVEK
jgi:hypothetical protein